LYFFLVFRQKKAVKSKLGFAPTDVIKFRYRLTHLYFLRHSWWCYLNYTWLVFHLVLVPYRKPKQSAHILGWQSSLFRPCVCSWSCWAWVWAQYIFRIFQLVL